MKVKKALFIVSVLVGCVVSVQQYTSGIGYQSEADVEFTFGAEMTLVLSNDIALTLLPGTSASGYTDITVSTTNPSGLSLGANVGTDDNPLNNALVGTSGVFASLNYENTGSTPLSAFADDTWGYALANDRYFGLPPVYQYHIETLKTTNTNGSSTFRFYIGAKASATKPAGSYTNVINFYLTARL